jgi:hypothetical protein
MFPRRYQAALRPLPLLDRQLDGTIGAGIAGLIRWLQRIISSQSSLARPALSLRLQQIPRDGASNPHRLDKPKQANDHGKV